MDITFHANPSQPHQAEHALWFKKGLKKHGLNLNITSDIKREADIHIISGPHYAFNCFKKVIMIDRALWHQDPPNKWHSMDWVSVGWVENGKKLFKSGSGRKPPKPKNGNSGRGTLFLADYDGPTEYADTIRLHPARKQYKEQLHDCLRRHAKAIGYNTSALVTAALEGLEVECKSQESIMSKHNWLELLAYTDWKYSEIENGELWDHLQQ